MKVHRHRRWLDVHARTDRTGSPGSVTRSRSPSLTLVDPGRPTGWRSSARSPGRIFAHLRAHPGRITWTNVDRTTGPAPRRRGVDPTAGSAARPPGYPTRRCRSSTSASARRRPAWGGLAKAPAYGARGPRYRRAGAATGGFPGHGSSTFHQSGRDRHARAARRRAIARSGLCKRGDRISNATLPGWLGVEPPAVTLDHIRAQPSGRGNGRA